MKSCLRSPRLTPTPSAATTPSGSGCTSPSAACCQLPCLRKTVSFCQEDAGLEEVFQADDWDRTPLPVAPKLSYSDLLELKQIMQSLPRASRAHNASTRMPFSTSTPENSLTASAECTPPQFPIARLAAAPSLTPSKWKNRDDSALAVDPAILPYLDSVPIRLLPLLPAPQEPQNTTPTAAISCYTSPSSSLPTSTQSSSQTSSSSSTTTLTPTPTSPPVVSLASPPATPTRRRPNFSFVPLLPVHEPVQVAPAPSVPLLVQSATPTRHFNMPFVPLLPPEEQSPAPAVLADIDADADVETPLGEASPPLVSEPEHMDDEENENGDAYFPSQYTPTHARRSPSSTPSLSSASDTDTESEAPSGHSGPASPADDYDALTHYFAYSAHTYHGHHEGEHEAEHEHEQEEHNPYFPPLHNHHHHSHYGHDAALDNVPIASAAAAPAQVTHSSAYAVRKLKLQALPSPALAPPSPFALDDAEGVVVHVPGGARKARPLAGLGLAAVPCPPSLSSSSASSSSSSSSSSASARSSSPTLVEDPEGDAPEVKQELGTEKGLYVEAGSEEGARREISEAPPSLASSLSDTPELTIETLRSAYDRRVVRAAAGCERERERERGEGRDVLGPSLSRAERRA